MSNKCPVCGKSGDDEPLCDHYILMIWEENFDDMTGAPLWVASGMGRYAYDILDAVDDLFTKVLKYPRCLKEELSKSIETETAVGSLIESLRSTLECSFESGYYEGYDDCLKSEANSDFNNYAQEVYHAVCDDFLIEFDTVMGGVGLSWGNIYFWSKNAKKTAKAMIAHIENDSAAIAKTYK